MTETTNNYFLSPLSDIHIQYCLKYVNLLLSHGVRPVLIFDGRHLPAKKLTEDRRGISRREAKEKAKELMREGKMNEARTYINRAVNITHDMANQLMRECRKKNVDCIVAPYEADGQLGYLSRRRLIDYVITEDSDLTLFGCDNVIFKFDLTGQGMLFEAKYLHLAMGCREDKYEFRKFEMLTILSGCDYLDSLKGVGLMKALKFVLMTEETDVRRCLKKLPQYLNLKVVVDDEYIDGFLRAQNTFRHMVVYDPTTRKQVRLTEPKAEDLPYCNNAGEIMEDEQMAFQLAIGNLNPFTMNYIDNWDPDQCSSGGIWRTSGGGDGEKKTKEELCRSVITVNKPTEKKTKRRQLTQLEIEEEDNQHSMNTSVDILNMYLEQPGAARIGLAVLDEPPQTPPEAKKIRLSNPGSEKTTTRNPFLKKITDESEKVKEEKTMHCSLLQQANALKTESPAKSKFQKTKKVDKKISVVSRFFSSSPREKEGKSSPEGGNDTDEKKVEKEIQENIEKVPELIENEIETGKSPEKVETKVTFPPKQEGEIPLIPVPPVNLEMDTETRPPTPSVESSSESEAMDTSAFVSTQYSTTSCDSQMQRENEQSPVPWNPSQEDRNDVQDTMIQSCSQQSDKENDHEAMNIVAESKCEMDDDNDSAILISEEDTPVKVKSPVKKRLKTPPKRTTAGNNNNNKKRFVPIKGKQPTLTAFFKQK